MSTNINISVGESKLLDQARLQQNASRQAQLEKEANKRLSNEAEINRVNSLAAQGKDANGNTITAPGTAPKPLRDEPASTQTLGEPYLLLRPSGTFDANGDFATKTVGFFKKMGKSPILTTNNDDLEYEPTGGPNGAPCIAMKLRLPLAPIGQQNFTALYSKYYFPGSTNRYKENVKDYTLECFVKMSDNFTLPSDKNRPTISFSFGSGVTGTVNIEVTFDAASISLPVNVQCVEGGGFGTTVFNQPYAFSNSPVAPAAWQHLAVTREGNALRFFINGTLMNTAISPKNQLTFTGMPSTQFFRFVAYKLTVATTSLANDAGPIRLHGYRFTPKALYTASFTPPLNL